MRFSLLLPFLGSVWAAPTEPSNLSIFDNPTIPSVDAAELGTPDDSPLSRRATAPPSNRLLLNISSCNVQLKGDNAWNFKPQTQSGMLYISSTIPSPGTKNGNNTYDLYLQVGNPLGNGGAVIFGTNRYLMSFPNPGPNVDDYSLVTMTSKGIKADIDFSNVGVFNQPQRFSTELLDSSSGRYGPPAPYYVISGFVNANVGDNGQLTGMVWLDGHSMQGVSQYGKYYGFLTGWCVKSTMPFKPPA
ncbi:hypothetical protein ACHAPT_010794 [Fusarium lateritium]